MAVETRTPEESASWHSLEATEVLTQLTTSEKGLTDAEARPRLEVHGPNELQAFARSFMQ